MNFTDSPFEKMMKQPPKYAPAPTVSKPPKDSVCHGCGYWNGVACVGVCYRNLVIKRTSDIREPTEPKGSVGKEA